jgi:hypothetical protein
MIVGAGAGSDGGVFLERFGGIVIVLFLLAVNWSRSSAAC